MNISANTVTIIIALAAIISPILVAFINNRHNAKMKKLDYEHSEKLKTMELEEKKSNENAHFLHSIYENYFQSTSRCIANPSQENIKLYGENYSISFIYFPPEFHEMLQSINDLMRKRNYDAANDYLEILAINLSVTVKNIMK